MKDDSKIDISNRQRRMLRLLVLFTLGGAAFTLLGEAFKTHLIWYIRFADFVDLLIIAPLYLISLVLLYEQFLQAKAPFSLRRVFLVLAMLFLYGHAMHVTANSIDTFSNEIRNYRSVLPADTYDLIYFFDETLSHLIVFLSRYSLFACLLALEVRYLAAAAPSRPQWSALGAGILFGLWEAIVFIEGQKVILVPLVVVGLAGFWLWLWRRSGFPFLAFLRTGPVAAFVVGLLPSLLVGLGLYASLRGGFVPPSANLR